MTTRKTTTTTDETLPELPAMAVQKVSVQLLDAQKITPDLTGDQAVKIWDDLEEKCIKIVEKYGPKYKTHARELVSQVVKQTEDRARDNMPDVGLDALENIVDRLESCENRIGALEEA